MDGLRFDLDFRITELEKSLRESLGNQEIELGFLKADLEKHLARKQIPVNIQIKIAFLLNEVDNAMFYVAELDAILNFTDGLVDDYDFDVYNKYHSSITNVLKKLKQLEVLVHAHH